MDLEQAQAAIAKLSQQMAVLEAERAVTRLQYAYGYYMDAIMMDDMIALFAQDAVLHIMGGVFSGKESITRFYKGGASLAFGFERTGPDARFVTDHPQMQPYVEVAPDGLSATGRFRTLQSAGLPDGRKEWSSATYENDYACVDGVWKITVLRYHLHWHWLHDGSAPLFPPPPPRMGLFPHNPLGPDALVEPEMPGSPPARPMRFDHPAAPYSALGQPLGRSYVEGTLGMTLKAPPSGPPQE